MPWNSVQQSLGGLLAGSDRRYTWFILKTYVSLALHSKRYETRLKKTAEDCNVLHISVVHCFEKDPHGSRTHNWGINGEWGWHRQHSTTRRCRCYPPYRTHGSVMLHQGGYIACERAWRATTTNLHNEPPQRSPSVEASLEGR